MSIKEEVLNELFKDYKHIPEHIRLILADKFMWREAIDLTESKVNDAWKQKIELMKAALCENKILCVSRNGRFRRCYNCKAIDEVLK